MESGIDPGQDYYTQDYYSCDHGYDLPQYGSRRKLISPTGLYDEYGDVVVDDDGCYYYSPQESDGELGTRKRRIKLVVDREYETSSTGEDSVLETQRGRIASNLNSHSNINGSIYVAQNGSIIRTRRSVNTPGPPHTHANANNNLKIPSPVFSSRLVKHFKKLDKMAATLEERLPLRGPSAEAGGNTLRTFQGSGTAAPGMAADRNKPPTGTSTHQSSSGSSSGGSAPDPLRAARVTAEQQHSTSERGEERESKVDGSTTDDDQGLVMRGPLGCPGDRTHSDEEELWMGPWNNLHIPMTKL